MKKIIVYSLLIFILFTGFKEIKASWQENKADVSATLSDVSEKASGWFSSVTQSGKELKESLNEKIRLANEKYESMRADIEATAALIKEKQEQLDQTLKEMEEAKKALDELLEKDKTVEGQDDLELKDVGDTTETQDEVPAD